MANTSKSVFVVDAGDGNTPTHHAMTIFHDTLKLLQPNLFGRVNGNRPVGIDTTLKGKAGETINYHFTPFANADPIRGQDATIEGNEKRFDEFRSALTIDDVNFPFGRNGNMTEQRTIINTRQEMRRQIAEHFAQYNHTEIYKRLSGIGLTETESDWESATGTTDRVNGDTRCIRASGANGYATVTEAKSDNTDLMSSMTASDKMNPFVIMRAAVRARKNDEYRLTPLRVAGNKLFFELHVSNVAAYDLMTHPDWLTRAIMVGDLGLENDPIAMGSLGVIKNVIVHESDHVTTFGTAGSEEYSRNLLLGANAGVIGFAQTLTYVEELRDYRKFLGVNGSELRGELKLAFSDKNDTSTDIDYGVMQVIAANN